MFAYYYYYYYHCKIPLCALYSTTESIYVISTEAVVVGRNAIDRGTEERGTEQPCLLLPVRTAAEFKRKSKTGSEARGVY